VETSATIGADSAVRSSCSAMVRTTLLRKLLSAEALSSEPSDCSTRRSAERISSVRLGIYRRFTRGWMQRSGCRLPDGRASRRDFSYLFDAAVENWWDTNVKKPHSWPEHAMRMAASYLCGPANSSQMP